MEFSLKDTSLSDITAQVAPALRVLTDTLSQEI